MSDDSIFIDGDFNDSYESRIQRSKGKKNKPMKPNQTEGSTGVEKHERAKREQELLDEFEDGYKCCKREMEEQNADCLAAGATAEQERSYNKVWNDAIEACQKMAIDFQALTPENMVKKLESLKIANR